MLSMLCLLILNTCRKKRQKQDMFDVFVYHHATPRVSLGSQGQGCEVFNVDAIWKCLRYMLTALCTGQKSQAGLELADRPTDKHTGIPKAVRLDQPMTERKPWKNNKSIKIIHVKLEGHGISFSWHSICACAALITFQLFRYKPFCTESRNKII